jgi:putative flippase GtrA
MERAKQILRFGSVGVLNTVVDVTLYVALRHAGFDILFANILSTSVALCMSYVLNYRFTFRSSHSNKRLVWFFGITCFGLWLLQPIVITSIIQADSVVPLLHLTETITGNHSLAYNALPKLAATGVTLVWNYLWYSYKIFNQSKQTNE